MLRVIVRTMSSVPAQPITLNGNTLTAKKLDSIRKGSPIVIDPCSKGKVDASRKAVEFFVNEQLTVYGITTGFGSNVDTMINPTDLSRLQRCLTASHATAMGPLLKPETVKAMAALRVNSLLRGHSGIRFGTIEAIVTLVNNNTLPPIGEKGSVGASGDLAPLAHLANAIQGVGLLYNPELQRYEDAEKVFKDKQMTPVELEAKEGLALINGTQLITAIGSEALTTAEHIFKAVLPTVAISSIALKENPAAFSTLIHEEAKPHRGQIYVARVLRNFLTESKHKAAELQDPYSGRCLAQILGPSFQIFPLAKEMLETEFNTSNDNPLINSGKMEAISGGNFHGEFPAKALDLLKLSLVEIGNVSTARQRRAVDKKVNRGLPAYLTAGDPGINSGVMTLEIGSTSLVMENKQLVYPSSAQTESTGAGQEDHVSNGPVAAKTALEMANNTAIILANELKMGCQAIHIRQSEDPDFRLPKSLQPVYEQVNEISPPLEEDRFFQPEMEKLVEAMVKDSLLFPEMPDFD
ncbi:histidine ammonia-lyase [Candidatus Marinamargulisbacteria bacterium SCGC AG-343-D04]|nr:histidine ammonia-lyase [Candidatus Marinamargulisbacteria bacterium SCGC AG-343-D04]